MRSVFMFFLLLVSVSLILMGCSDENWEDSFDKTEKIEVTQSGESETIAEITDKQKIKEFINSLNVNKWNSKELPEDAIEDKKYKMYQGDTTKLLEKGKDKELNEVADITTYKNVPYINFNFKGISFSFEVPADVDKFLLEYK